MGRGFAAERVCQPTAMTAAQQLRGEVWVDGWPGARVGRMGWDLLVRPRRVRSRPRSWKPVQCFSTTKLRLLALEVDVCTCDSSHTRMHNIRRQSIARVLHQREGAKIKHTNALRCREDVVQRADVDHARLAASLEKDVTCAANRMYCELAGVSGGHHGVG